MAEVYDKRLNGELQENGGGSTEWQKGYQNLRNVNYFFEYYKVPETEETKDVLSMKGEAYFFRAYWHFYLLTRFGSIPVTVSYTHLDVYKRQYICKRMGGRRLLV